MKAIGGWFLLLICLLARNMNSQSQSDAIELGGLLEGKLASNETHRYELIALELTLASFHLAAVDDTLDPRLEIYGSDGRLVAANDDYDYPNSLDAVVQAFVFPRSGMYTVAVSGFADSSGAYRLYALPGYDVSASQGADLSLENWESVNNIATVSSAGSGRLAVEVDGMATSALLLGSRFPQMRDFYFEVQFENVSSSDNWQIGLVFRYARPDLHSRLVFNKRGFWRIERIYEGDITVLRDWSTHPAIVAGESAFRLGILASGQHFDVVYNGQAIGSLGGAGIEAEGGIGIAMRSADVPDSRMFFQMSDVIVTVPTRAADKVIFPAYLTARGYRAMADVLARQQLVPVDGEIKMVLPRSSVRHNRAGVTTFLLGSGLQFRDFALGAKVKMEIGSGEDSGCGIFFHYLDDAHYQLAYFTADGAYGFSRRSGDRFEPGLFGERPETPLQERAMLLIVHGGQLHYFLDGHYVGGMDTEAVLGSVGIAAVNYAPVDTHCVYEDLWALSFDD